MPSPSPISDPDFNFPSDESPFLDLARRIRYQIRIPILLPRCVHLIHLRLFPPGSYDPLDLSAAILAFTISTGDLFAYRVSPSHYPDFTPNYSLTIG